MLAQHGVWQSDATGGLANEADLATRFRLNQQQLIVEVPIDNQIEGWTVTTLPANWQPLRDRWELFHVIRTWVSVLALALLIVGALFRRDAVREAHQAE